MTATKVAAMFKPGDVASRQDRRQIMRHLRHHFQKILFEPDLKVQMFCEGRTEIFHGQIKYSYEKDSVKETIDFTHKNFADKAAAQLM